MNVEKGTVEGAKHEEVQVTEEQPVEIMEEGKVGLKSIRKKAKSKKIRTKETKKLKVKREVKRKVIKKKIIGRKSI